jgi:hypothetical protein
LERSELALAVVIALVSLVIGFVIYSFFYHPLTGDLRSRFKGGRKRSSQWLKTNRKRIGLILALAAGAIILLYLSLHFRAGITHFLKSAVSVLQPKAGLVSPPEQEGSEERSAQPPESVPSRQEETLVADHRAVNWVRLDRIPATAIEAAKQKLHIFYSCGTHGSQITYGVRELPAFKGPMYKGLDLQTTSVENDEAYPAFEAWADSIRAFLNEPSNRQTNVIMWFWTNELSTASVEQVDGHLNLMSRLEKEYPQVRFVYMTGHLDGTGKEGNLHQRNEQIRDYCRAGRKALFDFADIESYDPDGNYYLDKRANDGCWYDSDGDGLLDKNWAKDWSEANPDKWYKCYSAHTYPINANMKAYAAWWLWATLAGWQGS